MRQRPLAYHITFGTYGTRLHGNPLGAIDRSSNKPGDPIVGENEQWESMESKLLEFNPVYLSNEQRRYAHQQLPAICERGDWGFHIAAIQPNHAHVLLSSENEGKAVRRWLKLWLAQSLNAHWTGMSNKTWWAEGGSVRWVYSERYFQAVYNYINDQRLKQEE